MGSLRLHIHLGIARSPVLGDNSIFRSLYSIKLACSPFLPSRTPWGVALSSSLQLPFVLWWCSRRSSSLAPLAPKFLM